MTGLEKINGRIISDAQNDAEAMLAEARKKCEEISAGYSAKAAEIKEKLNAAAEREGESIVVRAKSSAAMVKRNTLLEAKSRMIDEAFAEAAKTVLSWDGEKYCDFLASLLSGALLGQIEAERISAELYGDEAQVNERYEVVLNQSDRKKYGDKLLEKVRRLLIGKLDSAIIDKLVLSDVTREIDGGVILRYGDVESNCSLSTLLSQARGKIEGDVSRALFGEN